MHQVVTECRCCGSPHLIQYMNLGLMPLANAYLSNWNETEVKYPLEVDLCTDCSHNQLSIVVDPDILFKDYAYITGTSQTFKDHCRALALNAFERYRYGKPRVLDIACNDGTLLECFHDLGCEVLGVDPAENLKPIMEEKDLRVVVDYWRRGISDSIFGKWGIITATNVFAHVHDNLGFLEECRDALAPDGLIVIEVPYACEMIRNNQFDTIYHEHLSYFTVHSFEALVRNVCDLYIQDLEFINVHGGSVRFILRRGNEKHGRRVREAARDEIIDGYETTEPFEEFRKRVDENCVALTSILKVMQVFEKPVVGYGASAKGNTMLNACNIGRNLIQYIVDDTPGKVGKFTPGMRIPIVSRQNVESMTEEHYFLMSAWNFKKEIQRRIRGTSLLNHKCLFYVPDVHITDLKGQEYESSVSG